MSGCCGSDARFDGCSTAFRRALLAVIAINAVMFGLETSAGLFAGSKALAADALDFLGDTLTYSLSLAVLGAPLAWRARAALAKGASLALMGVWVLGSTLHEAFTPGVPKAEVMGVVGLLALAANLGSVALLARHRDGDANVRSVWLCSRNDAIGNVAVLLAASGVFAAGNAWPDLVVAALLASLFLWSSAQIVRQAAGELTVAGSGASAAR